MKSPNGLKIWGKGHSPNPSPPVSPHKDKGDKAISSPQNFVHEVHVDTEFNWSGSILQDPNNVFELLQELGEGAFGCVYKARVCSFFFFLLHFFSLLDCMFLSLVQLTIHKFRESQKIFAVKVVRGQTDDIEKEIKVLQGVRGDNIVRYYGSVSFFFG
jgi:hypothetical protein